MKETISLLGIPFRPINICESRRRIAFLLRSSPPAKKIYTPNASILWSASRSSDLRRLLMQADLLLPDGSGVILAAKQKGTPLPERITGIDTAEWLLRYGAKNGFSFYFLGGKPRVAKAAAMQWQQKIPALRIAGYHHGYFKKTGKENDRVLAHIQKAKPDILFVCFGFPEQERWIDRYAHSIPSLHLAMGLGGTLDVWSGQVKRAPRLVQTMGLEWLWRTVREPKRIKNLATLPKFLMAACKDGKKSDC